MWFCGETRRTEALGRGIAGAFFSLLIPGVKPLEIVCLSMSSWVLTEVSLVVLRKVLICCPDFRTSGDDNCCIR